MDLSKLKPVDALPLKERVYRRLLDAVVASRIPPGTELTLSQISEQLGVSLMPVREAVRKLEAGNFISISKNRRITVKRLSASDLNELLEIRLQLELPAARKSLENCTEETVKKLEHLMDEIKSAEDPEEFLARNRDFHYVIYETANKPIFLEVIRSLWERLSPYFHIYVARYPDFKALKIKYHEGMLKAMRKRDAEELCKWLEADLKKAAELVTAQMPAPK